MYLRALQISRILHGEVGDALEGERYFDQEAGLQFLNLLLNTIRVRSFCLDGITYFSLQLLPVLFLFLLLSTLIFTEYFCPVSICYNLRFLVSFSNLAFGQTYLGTS